MSEIASVLALNPGSSSLKASLRGGGPRIDFSLQRLGTERGSLVISGDDRRSERPFQGGLSDAVDVVADELSERDLVVDAVGYRVVHGGPRHYRPTIIGETLLADLREAAPMAPLHLPGDLCVVARARQAWPRASHVACFDTGFHHDLPEYSTRLPVAAELTERGVRRYGFHGLSIQSVLHARPDLGGAVIAHLGSGCSVTAVADGRPLHTSMSFTPTSGMVSGTRTGDLDPEVVLYLSQQHGYAADALRKLFDSESGLAGIAGGRHDIRDLMQAHDAQAMLALEIFTRSAAMAIASCATALDRWDSLVFTGGVGENAPALRARICERLLPLRRGQTDGVDDAETALADSGLSVLVVAADEEGVIDRLTRGMLGNGRRAGSV